MNLSAVEQAEKREQEAAEAARQDGAAPDEAEAGAFDARSDAVSRPAAPASARAPVRRSKPGIKRLEAWMSRMSARFPLVQRLSSLLFLPYAFRSGIKMKPLDTNAFTAVLPFKRFNRNWYNAMAGGALLANSEIAAGMYLFGECGGGYSVVCKRLEYNFLRPCFGPAIYKVTPCEDIKALLESGEDFNITLDINVVQQLPNRKGRDRRVGRSKATFYATPKSLRTVNRGKGKAPRRRPAQTGADEKGAGASAS